MSQGQVVALVNYNTAQILVELIKLANMIVMVNKAIACGDRVQEVFEREPGLSTPNEETKPGWMATLPPVLNIVRLGSILEPMINGISPDICLP